MSHLEITRDNRIAQVVLSRGKVNAIHAGVVNELHETIEALAADEGVGAVVLTGRGKFFSFGLDVPELYPLSPEDFGRFLTAFTSLYLKLFTLPKPIVAAVNGHAIAGGCMLALPCDRRLMAAGTARIGLNEAAFGSSVFAGSVEMLQACVGHRNAETILFSGEMLAGEEALALGLIDRLVEPDSLLPAALEEARAAAARPPQAYQAVKRLLRGPAADRMREKEAASIRAFIEIWYSDDTRTRLKDIAIRPSP